MIRISLVCSAIFFTAFFTPDTSETQRRILLPIAAHDNGTHAVTNTFGLHEYATPCIDRYLDGYLSESELPPVPPLGIFDFTFFWNRGNRNCVGEEMLLDMRPFTCGSNTFMMRFQAGEGGYPMTFTRPAINDSSLQEARIEDLFGGVLLDVDMMITSIAVVTHPELHILYVIIREKCSDLMAAKAGRLQQLRGIK